MDLVVESTTQGTYQRNPDPSQPGDNAQDGNFDHGRRRRLAFLHLVVVQGPHTWDSSSSWRTYTSGSAPVLRRRRGDSGARDLSRAGGMMVAREGSRERPRRDGWVRSEGRRDPRVSRAQREGGRAERLRAAAEGFKVIVARVVAAARGGLWQRGIWMRARRGPEGEPGRSGTFGRRSRTLARMPRAGRRVRGTGGVLARARRGRDPGAALSNDVKILHSEGSLWVLRACVGRLSLVEVLEAALDDDECADETAKHDGIQHRDGRRIRDVAHAEYSAWKRCSGDDAGYDSGHKGQEDERRPEEPVRDTEGDRPAQTDVDKDENRDDEKACLAEGKREPKARGGAYASGGTAVRGTGPLGECLPDKDTQRR